MNQNSITLTVFTPTYNREKLLFRGYQALCRQTSHDFCWLIIDDGSVDNTRQAVESWIDESSMQQIEGGFIGFSKDAPWLNIRYCYKENGGLHTGYNKAIELMDSEICVCIDSDDYMPDDAVEIIVSKWRIYNNGNIAGLVGLDYTIDGQRLGGEFQEGKVIHYISLELIKIYRFDNKIVMRVDLLKKVAPQPSFPNEKNFNPSWMILKIDQIMPFVLINNNLCFVDYQTGGMSNILMCQYFNSPRSFLELRKLYLSLQFTNTKFKIKNNIHLVAQSIIAKKNLFKESPNPIISLFFLPLGILLFLYMNYKYKSFINSRSM